MPRRRTGGMRDVSCHIWEKASAANRRAAGTFALLALILIALVPAVAGAEVVNLREPPFAAVGDGAADDGPALRRALGAAEAGDTLLVPPGVYRILLDGPAMQIPDGVTLWGHSAKSRFVLHSSGDGHREFLRPGSNVTIEGITIERAAAFPIVLLPIFGDVSDVALRHCRFIGNSEKLNGPYCHAIQLGVGALKNLSLHGVEISDCTYGLFQANDATGVVDGVMVERSRFERNTASDLEFNAPGGRMQNVHVRDCSFRDNRCTSASAGFAVGFANVQNGRVEDCDIRGYGSEALHVEDRSADIVLSGNTIVGASMLQPNGVILVIRDSRRVKIENNFIDARRNTSGPHLVLVTAGGETFACPRDVVVKDNVLVNGPETRPWYLQPGSGPPATGNLLIPAADAGDGN